MDSPRQHDQSGYEQDKASQSAFWQAGLWDYANAKAALIWSEAVHGLWHSLDLTVVPFATVRVGCKLSVCVKALTLKFVVCRHGQPCAVTSNKFCR